MPPASKAPVVPSDTIEINNTVIRCQKAHCLVDAIDVMSTVTNSASSAERLVWSRFKLTNPCVYRFRWDKPGHGLGRIVVRADQFSQELRQIKRGKCATCIKAAQQLDTVFPNAKTVLPFPSSDEQNDKQQEVDEEQEVNTASRKRKQMDSKEIVTIYAIVYISDGKRVYTGRTNDPDRRLSQHASRGSKCRLVRNAFRKHGRKAFDIEPILRCHKSDADTNESYWILQNNTLYPNGYNLRHGSTAGEEQGEDNTALVPVCTGIIPFNGIADEARACAEGWEDVAEMMDGIENTNSDAADVCKDILREVHPDAHVGDSRSYSANEVAAMLNRVRESL
jgi:hypothetical protein